MTPTSSVSPTPSPTPNATETCTASPTPAIPRPYRVRLAVGSADGQIAAALPDAWVATLDLNLALSVQVLRVDGAAEVHIYDGQGALLGVWNGFHSDGAPVAPGSYRVQAQWFEGEDYKGQAGARLTVLPAGSALLKGMLVAPNPVGRGASLVSLRWTPDGKGAWVRGRLYNVAGELVAADRVEALQGRLDWALRTAGGEAAAGGVYLWQVEVENSDGRSERRVLKFVVVH